MDGNVHIGTVLTVNCAVRWMGKSGTGYGVLLRSGEGKMVLVQMYVDSISTCKCNVVGRIG